MKDYIITLGSYLVNKSKRKLLKLCFNLRGQVGLEIGGPSSFFQSLGYFPIYLIAKRIDVVNYSNVTVWEGQITEGNSFNYYKNKRGYQFIGEASNLEKIKGDTYNFVLSCHSLEHLANPIKALFEWKRVLKKNGSLILILPKKESTFDHKRDYTRIEHLIADYENGIKENDDTHFEEIIRRHDISKDPGVSSREELIARTSDNYKNRCVHHHVFSLSLIKEMLKYSGFAIVQQQEVHNFHLVTYASKV